MPEVFRPLRPRDTLKLAIAQWEGKWQAMPGDPGNYLGGRLIGTMRGVTPAVLKAHLGITDDSIITPAFMQETVTLELAGEIGEERFWKPSIAPILWNPAADAVLDFAWGAGPGQAIKSTERDFLFLDNADFRFDARSIAAWAARVDRDGVRAMVLELFDVFEAFYDLICRLNPTLQQFRTGWHNRRKWYTPGGAWWDHWTGGVETDAVCAHCQAWPSTPTPQLLSKGMRGADVAKLQAALRKAVPTFTGAIDGIFGPMTDRAVKAFQEARGLVVDGWVGPATRAALGMA